MEQYLIIALLLIFSIAAIIFEILDRKKIPDLPMCSYISNYCTEYGNKQNIKYVIKELNNDKESIDALLSKIETDCCRLSNTVYWRMALIIALVTCIFFWIYNNLDQKSDIKYTTYFFLFIITWFLNYWMRNYLDYHYHNHTCTRVKENVAQLRSKISNK